MKNDAIAVADQGASTLQRISAEQIAGHVEAIRQVQREVMVKDKHYGTIPGCGDKPTLFKTGAELVLMTFQIHLSDVEVEDLSTDDCIRYRVKTIGSTPDGIVRGIGIGEASTDEDKYRWRRSVSDAEWNDTASSRRREKHGWNHSKREGYTTKQVRTNPADTANTILKMAKKRSFVDLALTATAASDVFTQDLEDMPRAPSPRSRPAADLSAGFNDRQESENLSVGQVENVTIEREGQGAKGPWTLFGIWVNGEVHKTFDETMAARARAAMDEGRAVSVAFKVGQYGRDALDVVMEAPAATPAPADDEQPPDYDEPPPRDDDDVPW